MAEACNASFQVHLQVPDEFVNLYNVAQLLAGPVQRCATNSLLLAKRPGPGHRLFEQASTTRVLAITCASAARATFDTRGCRRDQRALPRTSRDSVPCSRFDDHADPFLDLAEGRPPSLQALRPPYGTVWRWNCGCWRHRRQTAPAHREPGASIGARLSSTRWPTLRRGSA